jgi:ABC-2 type transport system permease protein
MINALNMNAFNLTTVTGFYGVMIVYFALILSIAAAMWGSDIIAKEERDRTVEFALTLPVKRSRLVSAKLAAAAVNCILLLLVTWGMTLVSAQSYSPDSQFYRYVSISMLAFLLMEMIFLALGILLGCALKQHKRAGAAAIAILLGSYFASILSGMSTKMEFLKYFSPFKYFDAALLLRESRLDLLFVGLSLAIIAACLLGAYAAYQRRDLYI